MQRFYARIIYRKTGLIRFSSHRDLIGIISKAVFRSELPVLYSGGFNPKPRISYFNPLQVGVSSECEQAVIQLDSFRKPGDIIERLNRELPTGITVVDAVLSDSKKVRIKTTEYRCELHEDELDDVRRKVDAIFTEETIVRKERSGKEISLNQSVAYCGVENSELVFAVETDDGSSISPKELLRLIFENEELTLKKLALLRRTGISEKV